MMTMASSIHTVRRTALRMMTICSVSVRIWSAPAGADQIRTLTLQIVIILSAVLLTVWILLAIVIIRYRHRPEAEASQTRGNLGIEIVWTAIPAVIVAVLFVLTVRTTLQIALPDPGAQFTTIGHQWWWEFDFPSEGFKSANEVYVPVDRPV